MNVNLTQVVETYRCESELDAETLIQTARDEGYTKGYELKKYDSQHKTKSKAGEIVDDYYLVKLTKIMED